jgi:hypothetical protein
MSVQMSRLGSITEWECAHINRFAFGRRHPDPDGCPPLEFCGAGEGKHPTAMRLVEPARGSKQRLPVTMAHMLST